MDKKVFLLDKDHYTKEMVENKTFEVTIFVIGCSPELTKETITVKAKTQKDAESIAVSGGLMTGYGVIDSKEI